MDVIGESLPKSHKLRVTTIGVYFLIYPLDYDSMGIVLRILALNSHADHPTPLQANLFFQIND